jgi:hypothetical protein
MMTSKTPVGQTGAERRATASSAILSAFSYQAQAFDELVASVGEIAAKGIGEAPLLDLPGFSSVRFNSGSAACDHLVHFRSLCVSEPFFDPPGGHGPFGHGYARNPEDPFRCGEKKRKLFLDGHGKRVFPHRSHIGSSVDGFRRKLHRLAEEGGSGFGDG